MNLPFNSKPQSRSPNLQRGSATILVLALLAILVLYMNSNQLALHTLKRDLRLIDQKQLKKFQPPRRTAQP
jgi:hypothetical protein